MTFKGNLNFSAPVGSLTRLLIPNDASDKIIHVILKVSDNAATPLCTYRRIIIKVK